MKRKKKLTGVTFLKTGILPQKKSTETSMTLGLEAFGHFRRNKILRKRGGEQFLVTEITGKEKKNFYDQ